MHHACALAGFRMRLVNRSTCLHHVKSSLPLSSRLRVHASASSPFSSRPSRFRMGSPGRVAVLDCREDKYDGIIIDSEALPADPSVFTVSLAHSLKVWQEQGKRGIWLKVPIDRAALIALAVENGQFSFHHAEQGYVMLTRWLHESPSTLPPNASHQVGVGAFVFNPTRQEVLMVQERRGPLKGKGFWKMPTGLVMAGEDVSEAVEREVFEETGVHSTFQGIMAIRQAHGYAFGKSDLFFLCALHTDTPEQPPLAIQDTEIEAATWMPLAEYYEKEKAKPALYQKILERCRAYVEGRSAGMPVSKLEAGMWGKQRQDLLCWAPDTMDETGTALSSRDGGDAPGEGARYGADSATP